MPLPSFLSGSLWKVATVGAGIISIVLVAFLLASYVENRNLVQERDRLTTQINDPTTGYVAQLSQARTNVETLKVQLNTQRESFQARERVANERLADTERRLAALQRTNVQLEGRLRSFLSTGPQGDSLEARVRDIDERAMREFVDE